MAIKHLRGLLVDPAKGGEFTKVILDYTKGLQCFYDLLECDYVEIVTRVFNGKRFAIICDEDGKLKGNQDVSIVTTEPTTGKIIEHFVGKCFICGINSNSDLKKITTEDLELLLLCQATLTKNNTRVLKCSI